MTHLFNRKRKINYSNRSRKNQEEISLREFVYRFVAPNTLVRVWTQNNDSTYTNLLADNTRYICMEYEIEHGTGYAKYLNKRFVKVTDILSDDCPEAVNIVIDPNCTII